MTDMPAAQTSPSRQPTVSGLEFAKLAARVADENHGEAIVILDLRGISAIADFFVIATGTSDRQMRAIADLIEEKGKPEGQHPFRVSGYENGTWILVDYVDVVIHLFDEERRRFYDLELLWGDAPRIEWQTSASA